MQPGDTVYFTKYALTGGIQAKVVGKVQEPYVIFQRETPTGAHQNAKIGHDVFATLDEAGAKAESLRAKRIKSLEKQIKNLKALRIEVK